MKGTLEYEKWLLLIVADLLSNCLLCVWSRAGLRRGTMYKTKSCSSEKLPIHHTLSLAFLSELLGFIYRAAPHTRYYTMSSHRSGGNR